MISFIENSVTISFLITIFCILRLLVYNKLPKYSFVILWLLVNIQALLPFRISCKYSFKRFLYPTLTQLTTTNVPHISNISGAVETFPLQQPPIISQNHLTNGNLCILNIQSILLTIWLIGILAILGFIFFSQMRNRANFCSALPIDNTYITNWKLNHIKRNCLILQSDKITIPCTYRMIHPIILLPKTLNYDDEYTLNLLLSHEYTHVKRYDIAVKYLALLVLAIHWFNPFVWLSYFLLNRDIELSCDESVIRQMNYKNRGDYAKLLICFACGFTDATVVTNYFSKNIIERRVKCIMKSRKHPILNSVFFAGLVALILTFFGTSYQKGSNSLLNHTDRTVNASSSKENNSDVTDQYKLLLDLRTSNYENLTLSKFRETSFETISKDEVKYYDLLNSLTNDTRVLDLRFTNDDAFFRKCTYTSIIRRMEKRFL